MTPLFRLPLLFTLAALSACAAKSAPPKPFDPAEWHISQIDGQAVGSQSAVLRFQAGQQRFSAYAGCNRFSGTYHQPQDGILTFGQPITTLMMCDAAVMETENRLSRALSATARYRQEHGELQLLSTDGRILLRARQLTR